MRLILRTNYSSGDADFAYVEIDADDVKRIERRAAAFDALRATDEGLDAIDFESAVYFYPGTDANIAAAIGDSKYIFVPDDFEPSSDDWTETECDVMTVARSGFVRWATFVEDEGARVVSESVPVVEISESLRQLETSGKQAQA